MEFHFIRVESCCDKCLWYSDLIGWVFPVIKYKDDIRYFFSLLYFIPSDVVVIGKEEANKHNYSIPNLLNYGLS